MKVTVAETLVVLVDFGKVQIFDNYTVLLGRVPFRTLDEPGQRIKLASNDIDDGAECFVVESYEA